MEWQENQAGQYVMTFAAYEAIIQHTTGTVWKAHVVHDGNELLNDTFSSLADAQAWCVTQIAAMRTKGS